MLQTQVRNVVLGRVFVNRNSALKCMSLVKVKGTVVWIVNGCNFPTSHFQKHSVNGVTQS